MSERPQWLHAALDHHRAGRVVQAERILSDVLRANPVQPDALNLIGLLAAFRGQHAQAQALIERAIRLAPGRGDFYAALGNVFLAQGLDERMVACYRHDRGRSAVFTSDCAPHWAPPAGTTSKSSVLTWPLSAYSGASCTRS